MCTLNHPGEEKALSIKSPVAVYRQHMHFLNARAVVRSDTNFNTAAPQSGQPHPRHTRLAPQWSCVT